MQSHKVLWSAAILLLVVGGVLFIGANVPKAPGLDYSIAVHIADDSGNLIAQSDGPINDFWGRGVLQTSSLVPGNYYIDLRTVQLPAGWRHVQYNIALVVYQSWDLKRLPVSGAADGQLIIGKVS